MAERTFIGQQPRDPKQTLAELMLAQGMRPETIETPVEGLGKLAMILAGTHQSNKLYDQRQQQYGSAVDAFSQAMQSGDPTSLLAMRDNPYAMQFAEPVLEQQAQARQAELDRQAKFDLLDYKRQLGPQAPWWATDQGVDPRYLQAQQAGAASTNVNVNTAGNFRNVGREAATKKYGQGIGETALKRETHAESAQQQNVKLDRMLQALDRGAKTGFGQETLLGLRKAAATLTGEEIPPDAAEQEVVRRVSNEMALRLRNPDSGLGLTGNTSNKDLQFLKASVPGLEITPEGNRLIIRFAKKVNKLTQDVAREQFRIIRENGGTVPMDLSNRLLDYVDNYDLLSDEERRQAERAVGGADPLGIR